MSSDPWRRPTVEELRQILETIEPADAGNHREAERLELSVPAELTTVRGNSISAMTREISRTGIGFVHRGLINPEEVTVTMSSDARQFVYKVRIEWCRPCANGMFISGGRFLTHNDRPRRAEDDGARP